MHPSIRKMGTDLMYAAWPPGDLYGNCFLSAGVLGGNRGYSYFGMTIRRGWAEPLIPPTAGNIHPSVVTHNFRHFSHFPGLSGLYG